MLSAKHGLLPPAKVVAPYDATLQRASRSAQRAWAAQVQKQLLRVVPKGAEVMMLAGTAYRRDLTPFLEQRGHRVEIPLKGMRLGEQLQSLSRSGVRGSSSDLNRFYAALKQLASLPGQGVPLGECNGRMPWSERGVYFFFEPGEYRSDGSSGRVVRVGTHAVSTASSSTLWRRLRAHRGAASGSGNHRGSVFRRHVGVALMKRGAGKALEVPTWGRGSSAPKAIRAREAVLESRVTTYLAQTRVYWVEVPDAAGRDSMRSLIERNSIALLSNNLNPPDRPGRNWLGRWSDREEIRKSGLWNVDYVRESYAPSFLDGLEGCIIDPASTNLNQAA